MGKSFLPDNANQSFLSTMARTVAAMGGHLTLIAAFPDQEPVVLAASQLGEMPTRRAKPA
jgi:hypothetical protein